MKMLELLDIFREEFNLTIVIATHNEEIAQTCPRKVVIKDGYIEEII